MSISPLMLTEAGLDSDPKNYGVYKAWKPHKKLLSFIYYRQQRTHSVTISVYVSADYSEVQSISHKHAYFSLYYV